jgi:hypothetical protein
MSGESKWGGLGTRGHPGVGVQGLSDAAPNRTSKGESAYRLLQVIGKGDMEEVWLAEASPRASYITGAIVVADPGRAGR